MRNRRRLLDLGDLDELLADERPAERGRHRIAILVDGVRFERREDVIVCELLAQIEHVRANGAGRQRAVAHLLELLALPEIHRHGDDLGVVLFLEPRNRHRRVQPA